MLHGWSAHSGIWANLLPELTTHYQVTLIDLPGHGHSSLINDYDIESLTQMLIENTSDGAAWLGWSLGGMIATHIAANHPQHISKLITVATNPKYIAAPDWEGQPAENLTHFKKDLIENPVKSLSRFISLQLHGTADAKDVIKQIHTLIKTAPPPELTALLAGLDLLQTLDLRSQLNDIQCPTLHIFGECDPLVPNITPQALQALAEEHKITTIDAAGHAPFLSHKLKFLCLIKEFL